MILNLEALAMSVPRVLASSSISNPSVSSPPWLFGSVSYRFVIDIGSLLAQLYTCQYISLKL